MFNSHIFNMPLVIPSELAEREMQFSYEVGIALSVAFLLIAFARLARPNIYFAVGIGLMKTSGLRAHIKEAFPLNKKGSILLLINYLLSSSLIVYLCIERFELNIIDQIVVAVITPFALLFGNLFALGATGWVTGEKEVMKEPIIMKILGAQAIGVIYFICALIWVLNSNYQDVLIQVVIWTFVIESSLRIIKSILTVYGQGVSWYYIILYFCTLEILPLFVVYYFILQDWSTSNIVELNI